MKVKRNLAPYLLIVPSFIYLILFFAWPMISSLRLAFQREDIFLFLHETPEDTAEVVGRLPINTLGVSILAREQRDELLPNGRTRPIWWFQIEGEDPSGDPVVGWAKRGDFFVSNASSAEVGDVKGGRAIKEWSLYPVKTMFESTRFWRAFRTTVLLMVLILPIQFVLAIIMALVLQSNLKFNTIFLYIYAIPLGISDLAAGLVWESMFSYHGFLNSFLIQLGIVDKPFTFIGPDSTNWMILAIVLAEVWRATSIVMVIVVSGLQAIPRDYMEAGEIFGATLWQRLRHIILPLLKPSLQVALILRTILAFQVFAVVLAIAGRETLNVLAYETYRAYDAGESGLGNPNLAASYAVFIMLLSVIISFVYLRTVRAQEEAATV